MAQAPAYFGKRQLIGGIALVLLLLLNVVVRDRNSEAVQAANAALDREYETVSLLRRISTSVVDAETGVRGFVITGAENYLEPYNAALPRFNGDLARLEQVYGDTPEQRHQLADLRARLGESRSELDAIIKATRSDGPPAAAARLATGHNKATMDAVRAELDTIEAQARTDIAARQDDARASARVARWSGMATGLLGVAASIGFIWSVRRNAAQQASAAAALFAEREHLRVTLASIGDAVIVTDAAGCITMINRVTEQLTGWSYGEAVGAPLEQVFRIVNEDSRQPVENPATRALREGLIVGLANHTLLIARDGTERPIADSAAAIHGASNEVLGAVLVFRDVTEDRHAEIALNRSLAHQQAWSDRLRQVAAASLTINAAATQDSIVGVIDAEARRILGAGNCRVTLADELIAEEEGHLVVPLTLRSGRRFGYIHCSDKSQGCPFDDDDRAMLTQLAQMASIAIENSRLYNDIRASDLRKDAFVATLAHELRNPLAPITNSLEALRATSSTTEQSSSRQIIERQVGQLVHLVDDLLDVARINQGKLELRRRRVQLSEVLAAAIETSRPAIESPGHALSVSQPSDPIWLDADLTRLAQVFANLLNNSAKYMEPGGTIEIAASADDHDVTVAVRDCGVGISSDLLPHVFDMFVQADRSLERAQGGLGIGLTLVRQLVQLHGGTVMALSDGPAQGSEFVVRLPRAAAPVEEQLEAPADRAAALPTLRVLVVDDNRDAVESLSLLLTLAGQTVAHAHDGREALAQFAAFDPDVVVLDIGLPVLNGYEVARQMRATAARKVALVALTGWGQDEDRRRTTDAGFDYHLVKPVEFESLKSLLASLVPPASA
jgi:PAS domain S-box-containing protein